MVLRGWAAGVDHALSAIIAAGQWLVVPVSLLLFLQWPLRDLVWAIRPRPMTSPTTSRARATTGNPGWKPPGWRCWRWSSC